VLQYDAACCSVLQYVAVDHMHEMSDLYGVTLVSRINKIIGLFCKRDLSKRRYSAKETYNFIDTTDRSHPISVSLHVSPFNKFVTHISDT